MINPTSEDSGRGVVYQASYPNAPREDGTITSFNDQVVHVRYKGDLHSKATSRSDLVWLSGGDRKHGGEAPELFTRFPMSEKPGFHRCHAGSENIMMPHSMEISIAHGRAMLSLESVFAGQDIRIAIEINACPLCLEPLTTLGRTLDRIKRVEGLK